MKITTGLKHEKNGGESFALFGKPNSEVGSNSIRVDCHIMAVIPKVGAIMSYEFRRIRPTISKYTESKIRKYAKKLAEQHLKKGFVIKRESAEYIRNDVWNGFYFFTKRK